MGKPDFMVRDILSWRLGTLEGNQLAVCHWKEQERMHRDARNDRNAASRRARHSDEEQEIDREWEDACLQGGSEVPALNIAVFLEQFLVHFFYPFRYYVSTALR